MKLHQAGMFLNVADKMEEASLVIGQLTKAGPLKQLSEELEELVSKCRSEVDPVKYDKTAMDYKDFPATFKRYTREEFEATDEHGYPQDSWNETVNADDDVVALWINPTGLYYYENSKDTVNGDRVFSKYWVIIGRSDFYGLDVFEGLAHWSEHEHGVCINNRPPTIIF
jgi:hypothetical protein